MLVYHISVNNGEFTKKTGWFFQKVAVHEWRYLVGGAMCPSWKMMEFVNGRDYHDYPIYEMDNKTCINMFQSPPTRYDFDPWEVKIFGEIQPFARCYSPLQRLLLVPLHLEGNSLVAEKWMVFPEFWMIMRIHQTWINTWIKMVDKYRVKVWDLGITTVLVTRMVIWAQFEPDILWTKLETALTPPQKKIRWFKSWLLKLLMLSNPWRVYCRLCLWFMCSISCPFLILSLSQLAYEI